MSLDIEAIDESLKRLWCVKKEGGKKMKVRVTLKTLEEKLRILENEFKESHTEIKRTLYQLQNRVNILDRTLRGGEGREFESLLFRISFLESIINVKKHIKPVTKKQMVEIRKMMKSERSCFYTGGKERTVDDLLGKSRG